MSTCPIPSRVLDVAQGALWALTYVLILRRGFLDKTCGMPLTGLVLASTWEVIFGVLRPTPGLPAFVVLTWLAIDACIVYQYLRYGPVDLQREGRRATAWFYARFAAVWAGALWLEHAFVLDWGDADGAYLGFFVNALMSLSFITMLERRRDVRGQSMYIAMSKLLGSVVAIPQAYVLYGSLRSLRAFMVVMSACDVAYAVLLYRQCRAQGIRPWGRL
jgi:hypothetical protein